MSEISQWLLQNLWAIMAAGGAIGCAIAALLWFTAHRNAARKLSNDNALREQLLERHHLLLLCGDAKALTDLAIQRNMTDPVFLRRMRAQPCYRELFPYFNENLRQQLVQETLDHDHGSALTEACRDEIERLEREWRATPL